MNFYTGIAARSLLLTAVLCTTALSLSACAPLIVGGAAASTVLVVTDRRTSGIHLEDQNIALKAESQIRQQFGHTVRIHATAYNRQILLTGDVPSQAVKSEAEAMVQRIDNVKSVFNQLTIGPVAPLGVRSKDTWITSKVKTTLLNTNYVPSATIAVTTDRGVVYLMGLVTEAESHYAATAASEVSGVVKVVKLFELISREEAIRLSGARSGPPAAEKSTEAADDATPDTGPTQSGVETMPVK